MKEGCVVGMEMSRDAEGVGCGVGKVRVVEGLAWCGEN